MTEKIELIPFDATERLTEPEDIVDLINDALESGHAGYIAVALGAAARAKGMTRMADETGVKRQALYKALSEDGNPTLETLLSVVSALGFKLHCEVADRKAA